MQSVKVPQSGFMLLPNRLLTDLLRTYAGVLGVLEGAAAH